MADIEKLEGFADEIIEEIVSDFDIEIEDKAWYYVEDRHADLSDDDKQIIVGDILDNWRYRV